MTKKIKRVRALRCTTCIRRALHDALSNILEAVPEQPSSVSRLDRLAGIRACGDANDFEYAADHGQIGPDDVCPNCEGKVL